MKNPSSESALQLEAFGRMVLEAVTREYPNQVVHWLASSEEARSPRRLHPAFYGSFDWHSAVHSHWCLVRILRLQPDVRHATTMRTVLERHLSQAALDAEFQYLSAPGREGFERPYGLAWLLQLTSEVQEWGGEEARLWGGRLRTLEALAAQRLLSYFRKLPQPVRTGEHSQSAFAMGMTWDWAQSAGDDSFARALAEEAARLFGGDEGAPVRYEPGGTDFLSPALAEADLLRRTLGLEEFASWLRNFLPRADDPALTKWLRPVLPADRMDGKLAHWDGLNLSRAWMLEAIVETLPEGEPLHRPLRRAAAEHREAGLAGALTEEYMGSHWLGSFAVYLLTKRGLQHSGRSPRETD